MMPIDGAEVPAPRSEEQTVCVCRSCPCCAAVRAELIDAVLDLADGWMAGGEIWVEMTRQRPLHPSMKRLLDAAEALDRRHHTGEPPGSASVMG